MSKQKSSNSQFMRIPLANRYEFYISGNIKPAENYEDMIHIIRNASESDEVYIHINSYGGDLFAAIQLMRGMSESRAMITTSVEGACMSAATMVFLAGHQYYVSEHSIFLFHNYSSGLIGKGGELYDQIVHERNWSRRLLESVYEDFLTKKEIKAILDNKDIYMDTYEVVKRLEKRVVKMNKKKVNLNPKAK